MRIGEMCLHDVATCVRSAPIRELAKVMRDRHVGDVIVVQPRESGEVAPIGIVTDRDLVVHVIAGHADADALTAGDLMHGQVVTALESESLSDAIRRMASHGVSRLPVVNDRHRLVGLITASDATRVLAQELSEIGRIGSRRIELELESAPAPGPSHWRQPA